MLSLSLGPLRWSRARLVAALVLVSVLALLGPPPAAAEDGENLAEWIRAHYTKREVRIPMRDGVELFAHVYTPNDAGTRADGPDAPPRTYPILLHRTPYDVAPYGLDRYPERLGPAAEYAREGFIFVAQDVRGKYLSEGEFVDMRPMTPGDAATKAAVDESTDTWDTIDWLVKNLPHHNGKVGMWGISYPGFYAAAGAADSHPALAAVSPQAPISDWFLGDDMHRHGAFNLNLVFNFFASFGQARPEPTTERVERFDHGTPDGYRFFLELGPLSNVDAEYFDGEIAFWNQVVAHPNYDEFWQSRNLAPHLDGIGAAVLTVGGWYDPEDLHGALAVYRSIEEKNPQAWNSLVMGPWWHGAWTRGSGDSLGDEHFGFATSDGYLDNVELPFFRHFLKGGPAPDLPEALVFETGADRWRRFDAWPPPRAARRTLHLREDGGLSFEAPPAEGSGEDVGDGSPVYDEYVSDPANPVPFSMEITPWWTQSFMVEDQRFAAWRPDVLVYESEPLEEPLTLAGPIDAALWVSTSGGDSDWIVKVIDVYPGEHEAIDPETGEMADFGHTQRLVRAEAFRGRFRNSYEHPEPFEPNVPTEVRFRLQDVLHTFRPGHRVMVQIQSTWFPFIDRNPGTWVDNIFEATEEDFVPVTNRVYRSGERPSGVEVRVLEGW